MTQAFLIQSNFTAGELDPSLRGRTDLQAYDNGAGRLHNVVVQVTGGVARRPGLAFVAAADGRGRLVSFELSAGLSYLLVFTAFQVDIYRDGTLRETVTTPYSQAQLADISWAQLGSSLIIAHPAIPLQRLRRLTDVTWTIGDFAFTVQTGQVSAQPFARFAEATVTLQASATTGSVTLTASTTLFTVDHLGTLFRLQGRQVRITNVLTGTQAVGLVLTTLVSTTATTDWDEQAFSTARGWPVSISFHQDRLVIGGSRDLPNGLWLSRTANPFNFDLGTGLDDEAISFRINATDAPLIRALVSSRHLQVFTSVGEWIVTGDPLTPTNIQLRQQSRIGSLIGRQVPPRDVDGATLFCARNGREIREFVFTETEQAYQAPDLALLARHLVRDPVDQDFDRQRRLFLVVMADGSLASIGIYRNADIVAWSSQQTTGIMLSIAVVDGQTYVLVERANGVFIERFDDTLSVDAGITLTAPSPQLAWTGLGHLNGQSVRPIANGVVQPLVTVVGGGITLSQPASQLVVGLPYSHIIEPLAVSPGTARAVPQDVLYRPVRITLRLLETRSLTIDSGNGLKDVILSPLTGVGGTFSGDRAIRALGWRRGVDRLPWRIEQALPGAFTLLSATTELKVNS